MKAYLATLVVALGCCVAQARACDHYDVSVLPFEPRVDLTLTGDVLSKTIGGGQGTFGATVVRSTFSVQGAPQCKIVVGYANPTIYIASELQDNACAFKHEMDHEQVHVSYYRESLRTLKERVEKVAIDSKPGWHGDVLDELDVVIPRHVAFDSQAEYRTNYTDCDGEIPRLLGWPALPKEKT